MKKIRSLSHFLLFLNLYCAMGASSKAQAPEPLRAEGEIPQELLSTSTDKYQSELLRIEGRPGKKKDKQREQQFLLESYFAIDNVLQSGMALFNDPATTYVNEVLKKLPSPNLRRSKTPPRAYVLNSAAVNAFATDQGILFVTLGLLAKLENEAQLAFILSHELIHYQRRHAINKFIKFEEIGRGEQRKRNADHFSIDGQIFAQSLYSRNLEEEADRKGLELYLESDYDPEEIRDIFSLLQYSYLPFEQIPVNRSFFEDEYFTFPSHLWLDTIRPVSPPGADQEWEKISSHPSSISRLNKLTAQLDRADRTGKSAFLLPEETFRSIQAQARYQLPFLQLYSENFAEAIYLAYVLLREYPDDLELKKIIGKALYVPAKYLNLDEWEYDDWQQVRLDLAAVAEGPVHRMHHLLSRMSGREMTVFALKYNWELYRNYPQDEELSLIVEDLFLEFAEYFEDLSDFDTTGVLSNAHSAEVDTVATYVLENPWDEDPPVRRVDKTGKQPEFWKYAFVKEQQDTAFLNHLEKGWTTWRQDQELWEYYESEAGRQEWISTQEMEEKYGKALGIQKVVIVNPFYLSLRKRKEMEVEYLETEEKQSYFSTAMVEAAKTSGLEAHLLDVFELSGNEIEKFNDIILLNRYFSQQLDHYDLSLTPGYQQELINDIADKYGTDYFLWTGVIALRGKNKVGGIYFASVLVPPLLPIAILRSFTPKYDFLYYAILFDVKSGRRSVIKMDEFNKRDKEKILRTQITDVFRQISQEPEERGE